MKLLNRSAFSVVPKRPFIEWTLSVADDELNDALSEADHQQEGTVYLFEEVAEEADFSRALAQHWPAIFDNELAAWDEFGDNWPQNRDLAQFNDWFDVKPQVLAIDLLKAPIMTAQLEGE